MPLIPLAVLLLAIGLFVEFTLSTTVGVLALIAGILAAIDLFALLPAGGVWRRPPAA